jgi:hypothetical protein
MGIKTSLQRFLLGALVIASAGLLGEMMGTPVGIPALGAPAAMQMAASPNSAAAGGIPRQLLEDVLHAAVQQAGVAVGEVTVIRAEATTWPDSALGCPLPGLVYATQPVEGYWIVVDAGGLLMDYRTDEVSEYRRCIDE